MEKSSLSSIVYWSRKLNDSWRHLKRMFPAGSATMDIEFYWKENLYISRIISISRGGYWRWDDSRDID